MYIFILKKEKWFLEHLKMVIQTKFWQSSNVQINATKISYSYPIYHLKKFKIQACQNIAIYKFILSNVTHDQHSNSEYMHFKMRLKSIAQVEWEHGRNFHEKTTWSIQYVLRVLPIVKTKNLRVRISPMQCTRALRSTFYYSVDYFTGNFD